MPQGWRPRTKWGGRTFSPPIWYSCCRLSLALTAHWTVHTVKTSCGYTLAKKCNTPPGNDPELLPQYFLPAVFPSPLHITVYVISAALRVCPEGERGGHRHTSRCGNLFTPTCIGETGVREERKEGSSPFFWLPQRRSESHFGGLQFRIHFPFPSPFWGQPRKRVFQDYPGERKPDTDGCLVYFGLLG